MQCTDPDCSRELAEADLAAGCCQECFEMLDPTVVLELRKSMGIETYSPPEIQIPEKQEAPISLPSFEQCPGCFVDLMTNDLSIWRKGLQCPYCQEPSPHQNDHSSLPSAETPSEQQSVPFILNSGSNRGTVFNLPVSQELGRNDFRQILVKPEYDQRRQFLSGEHFKIHFDAISQSVSIEDLGSLNGTFINGRKIVGPLPHPLTHGDVLNLHDLSFCLGSFSPPAIRVTHEPSGVVTEHPFSDIPLKLHFGRSNSEGGRESWFRMAQVEFSQSQDKLDQLETISRSHLYIELERQQNQFSLSVWNEVAKPPFEVQGMDEFTITTPEKVTQKFSSNESKSIIFTHGRNSFEVAYILDKSTT